MIVEDGEIGDFVRATAPVNVEANRFTRAAYRLCREIEELPASAQQTRCVTLASALLTALHEEHVSRQRAESLPPDWAERLEAAERRLLRWLYTDVNIAAQIHATYCRERPK